MTSGETVETQNISANANYKSSNSYATIEIDGATLSTQDIEENKIYQLHNSKFDRKHKLQGKTMQKQILQMTGTYRPNSEHILQVPTE